MQVDEIRLVLAASLLGTLSGYLFGSPEQITLTITGVRVRIARGGSSMMPAAAAPSRLRSEGSERRQSQHKGAADEPTEPSGAANAAGPLPDAGGGGVSRPPHLPPLLVKYLAGAGLRVSDVEVVVVAEEGTSAAALLRLSLPGLEVACRQAEGPEAVGAMSLAASPSLKASLAIKPISLKLLPSPTASEFKLHVYCLHIDDVRMNSLLQPNGEQHCHQAHHLRHPPLVLMPSASC